MTEVTGRAGGGTATPLLAREECDRFERQLQHALAEFVDEPRHAVEEADRTLEELAARFTDAVTRRRRTLRMSWQSTDAPGGAADDTEQLRLALRDYRELAERLLHDSGAETSGNGTPGGATMGTAGTAGTAGPGSGEGASRMGQGGLGDRMASGSGDRTVSSTGDRMAPASGDPMATGAPPPATGEERQAMAKPQDDSPTVTPTPPATEHPERRGRPGDIA
ncbi:hypothetical protein [Streptomyces sp. enrichment culture]|uniref:hypothetical protein n=1 Tax=Streptomyces sp. enrichment culture TaxID=1795815 RepID=UPI003F552186